MYKISDFFEVKRGISGLTEEYIYNNKGSLPVVSANSSNLNLFGSIDEKAIKQKDIIDFQVLCIIRVGNAGHCNIVPYNKFVATENVLLLYPKEEYRDKIDLRYVKNQIQDKLIRNARGDIDGQRNISAEIIKRISFDFDEKKQIQLSQIIKISEQLNKNINKLKINRLKNNYLDGDICYRKKIRDIFDCYSGYSKFTSEFIYNNRPLNRNDEIPIFSGSNIEKPFGYISKESLKKFKIPVINSYSLLVSRKGKAGTLRLMENMNYTINDDAYVLVLKKQWEDKLILPWFIYEYQELFYKIVTSKSDNGTFSKKIALNLNVDIPNIEIQKKSMSLINNYILINTQIKSLKKKTEVLLNSKIEY